MASSPTANGNKTILVVEEMHSAQKKQDTLEVDAIFKCCGFEPNSEIIRNSKGFETALTEKYEFVKVDEFMRVAVSENHNVFAMGDVIDQARINEIKLAHTAEMHAKYLTDLMLSLHQNNEGKPYHHWLLGDQLVIDQAVDRFA